MFQYCQTIDAFPCMVIRSFIYNFSSTGSQKYPVISNLPNTTSLPEDTPGGSTIFIVDVSDENVDSVHTFSMTVDPPEAEDLFSLHAPSECLS